MRPQFGWVNTTTETLNSTMNGFYDEITVSGLSLPFIEIGPLTAEVAAPAEHAVGSLQRDCLAGSGSRTRVCESDSV